MPITDDNRGDADDRAELEHGWEIDLYAEKITYTKTTVPVERVRLGTHVVTEQQEVTDTVRKEQFKVDRADA